MEGDAEEGGVGSGDEDVDCAVVEAFEDVAGVFEGEEGVVECGTNVED